MADDENRGIPAEVIKGIGVPLMLITLLAMVMIPLPPLALDILFTFNIAMAVAILLTTIYVGRPLDFGVFPTILLIVTLLRCMLRHCAADIFVSTTASISNAGSPPVR